MDDVRTTLDRPDEWSQAWLALVVSRLQRIRSQKVISGVMFYVGIIGSEFVVRFRVPEVVKLTSNPCTAFLEENLLVCMSDLIFHLDGGSFLFMTMLHRIQPSLQFPTSQIWDSKNKQQ